MARRIEIREPGANGRFERSFLSEIREYAVIDEKIVRKNEYRTHADSSTDETPPTTPSSCSSSSGSVPAKEKKPKTVTLTEDVRREAKFPSGVASNSSTEDEGWASGNDQKIGTDNYWIGQRIAEKKINTNTPNLRQYWEQNSLREQQEKQRQSQLAQNRSRRPFGFPKWRSNDAMTASLVASGKVPQLIPKDSQLPEHRKQKIEETERRAVAERQALQKSASNHKMQSLYKGKSMECLSMQVDYQPWYDRERIRSAISRESIGNIGAAKDRFERGDFPERDYRGGSSYALNNIDREPIRSGVTSAVPSRPATSMGKPNYAPPDVPTSQPPQISQNTASQNHQSHQNAQTVTMSPEHYAFLQYMRQNPNILSDFGIEVPKTLLNLSDNLQTEPETRQNTATPRQMAPVQPVAPTPHRSSGSGRYVKNGAGPRHHRRLYDVSVKQIPENKRQSMQDLDQQKAGDSLIAAEIRAIQEREDELRRSRSELGLPNLEDTLENWRTGHRLSSAVSTDAINHGFTHGYGSGRSLAASCDDLQWQQQQPYYERHYDGNSGYPMAGFDEMIYGPRRSGGASSVVHVRESPVMTRFDQPRNLRYN